MSDHIPDLGAVARNIRILRAAGQLTQLDLAERCQNVSQWHVSLIERGVLPTSLQLRQLAAALNVAPNVLTGAPLVETEVGR